MLVDPGSILWRATLCFFLLYFFLISFSSTSVDLSRVHFLAEPTSVFFSFPFILISSSPFLLPSFSFSFSYFHTFLFSSSFFSSSIFPFLSLFPPFLRLFHLFFSLPSSCLFFFHHSLFSLLFPSSLCFCLFCFSFLTSSYLPFNQFVFPLFILLISPLC